MHSLKERGKILSSIFLSVSLLTLPIVTFAGPLTTATKSLQAVGKKAGLGGASSNLPTLIGNLISVLLGAVGIIFVILIIISGIQYMTSAGEEGKVKEAKKRIISAVIGMIILVGAYAISSFVITAITNAALGTEAPTAAPAEDGAAVAPENGGDALGNVLDTGEPSGPGFIVP